MLLALQIGRPALPRSCSGAQRFAVRQVVTAAQHMMTQHQQATSSAQDGLFLQKLRDWGVETSAVDLKQDLAQETVQQIREAVTKHRLVVFRDQGQISGERQVQISGWFGELESTFYKHPKSPHPDIFRVSNNRDHGCTGVGRTGWHIDGSFMPKPFAYSTYHIVSCPSQGDTVFAPLTEVVESLSPEQRQRWERLYMMSDRRGGTTQPLIYSHPLTGQPTICLHTGMTDAYVWDLETPEPRIAGRAETQQILEEIDTVFRRQVTHLVYSHKWRPGDFIISDNLAVAHEASPQTQLAERDVGLRVMHRTTIAGRHFLSKQPLSAVTETH